MSERDPRPEAEDFLRSYPSFPRPRAPEPPHRPSPQGPDTKLARNAFALSFVPAGFTLIAAVVMACMVLARSRRDGRNHGRRRAFGALAIVGCWVVVIAGIYLVPLLDRANRDTTGAVTAAGDVLVVDLRVGDCVDTPTPDVVATTITVKRCDTPHLGEVYAVFDLEAPYVDAQDTGRRAEGGCVTRFEDYVGVSPRRSSLSEYYYMPQTAYEFSMDSSVACVLVADQPVTTTLRGLPESV